MYTKQVNPCYVWFSESLKSEKAISKAREDLSSYACTLTAPVSVFEKPEMTSSFNWLVKELENKKFDPRYSVAMAVVYYLASKHRFLSLGKTTSKAILDKLNWILDKKLPKQIFIDVYYYLKATKFGNLAEYKKMLLSLREGALANKDSDLLLEVEFSLGIEYLSQDYWDFLNIKKYGFNIPKLCKLGLLLQDKGVGDVENIINKLESECLEKISDSSLPIISLAIFEAEKLINTNLSTDRLSKILELLKLENRGWAKIISNIQENGVTVDLKELNRHSKFSISESLWSLNFLYITSRNETFQITDEDKNSLENYQKIISKGKFVTAKRYVFSFVFFNAIFIGVSAYLIQQLIIGASNPKLGLILFGLGLLFLVGGLYQAHKHYWRTGEFGIESWLRSFIQFTNLPF